MAQMITHDTKSSMNVVLNVELEGATGFDVGVLSVEVKQQFWLNGALIHVLKL